MADGRYTIRPTGRARTRLETAVTTMLAEGIASSESAAVTLIVVRGLDVIEAEQATRAANRPGQTDGTV
jgi:hypothetical protein